LGGSWAGLEPKAGDRVELCIVDASLARALFHGIPAARLLARARLAAEERDGGAAWEARLRRLLGSSSSAFDGAKRAIARHTRVAVDEGPLVASERTIAVLAWAVACDRDAGASLAEIAPPAGDPSSCDEHVLRACAAYDDRLASTHADKRAPAFEACARLATRASLGPLAWERLRAIAAQLERAEIGVRLFGKPPTSIFPRRVDDEIAATDRRMAIIGREALDSLVATDPRRLGAAVWRTEQAAGGQTVQLASFLADLGRLLAQEGALVVALSPQEPPDEERDDGPEPSWVPTEWSAATAASLADALERGALTFQRVRAAVSKGGEAALDAIGGEMLQVESHPFASAAFADVLARSARPRDVLRLVTYFAIAPDPRPAAHALGSCRASELPRVLGAWLEALLPQDGEEAPGTTAARLSACVASLRPYPQLYLAMKPLLSRLADPPPPSA